MTKLSDCKGSCELKNINRAEELVARVDTLRWFMEHFQRGTCALHITVQNNSGRTLNLRDPDNVVLKLPTFDGELVVTKLLGETLKSLHSFGVWMPDEEMASLDEESV